MKKKTTTKPASPSGLRPLVRQKVKHLLNWSPAFLQLPARTQSQIARDTALIAAYLTEPRGGTGPRERPTQKVDFPDFVPGLINGVFQAIVNASIEQMQAYAELVATVSKSIKEFRDENISDRQARDFLSEQCEDCFKLKSRKPKALPKKIRPATNRQQILATMVMMGINRIVVTEGKIRATVKRAQ